jgi:hypothetical protein
VTSHVTGEQSCIRGLPSQCTSGLFGVIFRLLARRLAALAVPPAGAANSKVPTYSGDAVGSRTKLVGTS